MNQVYLKYTYLCYTRGVQVTLDSAWGWFKMTRISAPPRRKISTVFAAAERGVKTTNATARWGVKITGVFTATRGGFKTAGVSFGRSKSA